MSENKKDQEITEEAARKIIAEAEEKKKKACADKVNAVLDEAGFILSVVPQVGVDAQGNLKIGGNITLVRKAAQ